MNNLNNIGANIKPCGTRETNISNRLLMLFILTFCFLLFKQEYIKTRVSAENLLADHVKYCQKLLRNL